MRTILQIQGLLLSVFLISNVAYGQQQKWEIGVSASFGRDYFDRKYHNTELWPGTVTNFRSNYSWGMGVFGEKSINSSLSFLVHLHYSNLDFPARTLFNQSTTGYRWYKQERHHWGAAGAGIRWYLNPQSAFRIFVDGKLKAEYFFAATNHIDDYKDVVWSANGHQRFVPTAGVSLGIKWRRLAISAEYDRNIARTFAKTEVIKTSIVREGISGKVAYTLFKSR